MRTPENSEGRIEYLPVVELPPLVEIQTRADISESVVAEYNARMIAGDEFPPLIVFHDGRNHILADGYHRLLAALDAGIGTIQVEIRPGGLLDALLYGLEANGTHGLRADDHDLPARVKACMDMGIFDHEEIAGMLHCCPRAVERFKHDYFLVRKPDVEYRVNARGQRRPVKYRRSNDPDPMTIARQAVALLERIAPDNPDRQAALRHVEARAAFLRAFVPSDGMNSDEPDERAGGEAVLAGG